MLNELQHQFEKAIVKYIDSLPQKSLYEPIKYILSLEAKRVRPLLVLLSGNAFGANINAMTHAAMAIEIFHNFSLVHDDIMDRAPLRRGKPSIHEKWNENQAILSGDAMLIEAYKMLALTGNENLKEILDLFNRTAIQVCEGQQLDMDFESRKDVTAQEYIEMISLKTAVLLGCSMKIGARLGNASKKDSDHMYNFGKLCGIAFQIQDDYLDAFGNPENVGKKLGGDIVENKKTFLLVKALELADESTKNELQEIYFQNFHSSSNTKVNRVLEVFKKLNIDQISASESDRYFELAKVELENTSLDTDQKANFLNLLKLLQTREK